MTVCAADERDREEGDLARGYHCRPEPWRQRRKKGYEREGKAMIEISSHTRV